MMLKLAEVFWPPNIGFRAISDIYMASLADAMYFEYSQ